MIRRTGIAGLTALIFVAGCTRSAPSPPSDPRDVIELRWLPSYPGESRSDVTIGLQWGLSLAGAQLPGDADVIHWHGDRMTVDLARADVVKGTQPAWRELFAAMKASGEYRTTGALDVGRFLSLTIGSPTHYYALTDATADYDTARARYRFDPRAAAIVTSAVALGSRKIELGVADRAQQLAFVAYEGSGSLADGTFLPHERELLDMMPNGQLRFALYDLDGHLKPGATPALTKAGTPAKCMWCHEAKLQPTYVEFRGVPGFYDRREFDQQIESRRRLLSAYRDGLDTQVKFRNLQDHTYMELLYITFEEPSLARLTAEWGVSTARATELLRGKATHAQTEYPKVGKTLYRRADVDGLAPYVVIAAPQDVREVSANEPTIVGVRP